MDRTVPINANEDRSHDFILEAAEFSDRRILRDVKIKIGKRISGGGDDLATVFEAQLIHPEADEFPAVVCKKIRRETHITGLGWREKNAYDEIRIRGKGSFLHLGHFVADYQTEDEYHFILERYGVTSYEFAQRASSAEERSRRAERVFASGYLALNELAGFGLAMRDVHPLNFLHRSLPASAPDGVPHGVEYDFVAVDFGHAYLGPPRTDGSLDVLPLIVHPEVLFYKDVAHRGFIDDLFSLAVVAHILLTEDAATPWIVRKSGARVRYDDKDGASIVNSRARDIVDFVPAVQSLVGGASDTFLKILDELLDTRRTVEQREHFVDHELPQLMVKLAPWANEFVEIAEAKRRVAKGDGRHLAADAARELASTVSALAEPHSIPHLAQLSDFRPQPRTRPERDPLLNQDLRRSITSRAGTVMKEAAPFLIAALSLPAIQMVLANLDHLLPAKWLEICSVLTWVSALVSMGIIGIGRAVFGPAKSLHSAMFKAIICTVVVFLGVIVVPSVLVVGIQTGLIYFPALSWRFEDWAIWPQWALFAAALVAAGILVVSWIKSDGKVLRRTAGALIVVAVASTLVAAAPSLLTGPDVTSNCGPHTANFTVPTANICIPTSDEWHSMPNKDYVKDSFVASMKFPLPAKAGTGPGKAAAAMKSTRFPCLNVYAVSGSRSTLNGGTKFPKDVKDPASPIDLAQSKGSDGRVNRVRLGNNSYRVTGALQASSDSTVFTGTTIYAALQSDQFFVQPDDYRSGTYGTWIYAVQRDCAADDQQSINKSVHALIASMNLNDRHRVDPMSMQYNDRALIDQGLSATNLDIPLLDETSGAVWDEPQKTITDGTSLAAGAVYLKGGDNAPWVQVNFMDHKPDAFDTATAATPVDGWLATDRTSASDTTRQNFFQKQTVGGKDYYVHAILTIQDTNAYDRSAEQSLKTLLSGTQIANPTAEYLKGAAS